MSRYFNPSSDNEQSSKPTSASAGTPQLSPRALMMTKRRKELFGDCALIEIIHLHDCLRGALKSLQEDVKVLTQQIIQDSDQDNEATSSSSSSSSSSSGRNSPTLTCAAIQSTKPNTHSSSKHPVDQTPSDPPKPSESVKTDCIDLEKSVAGRFKVIWSVFRAHSSAEDEFIWPALRSKMQTPSSQLNAQIPTAPTAPLPPPQPQANAAVRGSGMNHNSPTTNNAAVAAAAASLAPTASSFGAASTGLVQEEYEEDHADEERMFSEMDALLKRLREILSDGSFSRTKSSPKPLEVRQPSPGTTTNRNSSTDGASNANKGDDEANVVASKIRDATRLLSDHLMRHLEKEETQCMPLVVKHLSKAEIYDLVGNIMGKRSADTIAQIMTMAVQSLGENERQEMIQYMKQSMQNTFFDRWLNASGWGQPKTATHGASKVASLQAPAPEEDTKPSASVSSETANEDHPQKRIGEEASPHEAKRTRTTPSSASAQPVTMNEAVVEYGAHGSQRVAPLVESPAVPHRRRVQITSQAEMEKLIRAIATNPALNDQQKNATIQSLRDSVWKSNEREKQRFSAPDSPPTVAVNRPLRATPLPFFPQQAGASQSSNSEIQQRPRVRLPPSAYYKRTGDSKVELVWKNGAPLESAAATSMENPVPLFSATELAPTFHDGATGAVLGCPHYIRACKLRHPKSGRLYTCRLCCDQERELPMIRSGVQQQDDKLDRYAVTEVMCMTCNAVQPAEDRCIHPDCESFGKPFAKYFCRICHLYDGSSRPIFHCPYCNTCRLGRGLGIDFRHCMRCNACVSLDDKEHQCIPQKLQGSCPICHDTLFQSTEPLRGLKCGHVMHMTCFTQYRRTSYTCPLCMRSMEEMKDHFALLDAAIRMQPMPASFLYTMSNIYCQDCGKTGQVHYHFVGQKCPHCNSYNTREMGRVHNGPS